MEGCLLLRFPRLASLLSGARGANRKVLLLPKIESGAAVRNKNLNWWGRWRAFTTLWSGTGALPVIRVYVNRSKLASGLVCIAPAGRGVGRGRCGGLDHNRLWPRACNFAVCRFFTSRRGCGLGREFDGIR